MKTSDILNRAAEIVIERGHHKGSYGRVGEARCILGASFEAADLEVGNYSAGRPVRFPTQAPGYGYIFAVLNKSPITWNERSDTTEAMVIGVLHEAALLAKEAGE